MNELPEPRRWSHQVGARLKRLQASCRDWAPDKRRAALHQEFNYHVAEIPAACRAEYLRELERRFPTGATPLKPAAAPEETPTHQDDAEKILNDFVICCANLPRERREYFIHYLDEVGLIPKLDATPADPASEALKGQLHLEPGDIAGFQLALDSLKLSLKLDLDKPLNLYRLVRLLRWLFESLNGIEEFVWRAWGEIAPTSKLRPNHPPLREAISSYVASAPGAEATACGHSISATTWMAKSLTNGLGRGGKNFCDELFRYLAPESITKQIQQGGRHAFQGGGARCWEEYLKLFDRMDSAYLEQWLRTRVAEVAEEWFHCERENA